MKERMEQRIVGRRDGEVSEVVTSTPHPPLERLEPMDPGNDLGLELDVHAREELANGEVEGGARVAHQTLKGKAAPVAGLLEHPPG